MTPAPTALADILSTAIPIAQGAGAILREGLATVQQQRGTPLEFKTSEIDPVTEYDVRSERYIVGELSRLFPHHHIIGEEGGAYAVGRSLPDAPHYTWYVDPLDGTVNFAHGFPYFSVSMGLLIDGVPSVGVVYKPATGDLYAAARGQGATRNDQPIRVSNTPVLKRALLVTGFPYDMHIHDSNMKNFLGFQRTAQSIRRIGSAALNLCHTACGQMDGYWEMKTKPHDIAAGIVLVREAGGIVTDFDGNDGMLDACLIVASNGMIHGEMLAVLRAADDRT